MAGGYFKALRNIIAPAAPTDNFLPIYIKNKKTKQQKRILSLVY